MNKLIILLGLVVLSGCITITEKAENATLDKINLTFDEKPKNETVEDVIARPDLEIDTLFWNTLFPDSGQSSELTIKVINTGEDTVEGFNYQITLFKGLDIWREENHESNDTIAPGETTRVKETFTFYEAGKFKAEVYLDWDNSIKEQNELNNYKSTPEITVAEGSEQPSEDEPEEGEVDLGDNKCVDSDDGVNYQIRGSCVDDGPFILGMSDYCENNRQLIELYCTNTTQRCRFAEPYECYCKNGACV
jgi:hypothetical protein